MTSLMTVPLPSRYMAMFIDLDRLIVLATISRVLKIIPLVPGLCVLRACVCTASMLVTYCLDLCLYTLPFSLRSEDGILQLCEITEEAHRRLCPDGVYSQCLKCDRLAGLHGHLEAEVYQAPDARQPELPQR